jgi:hypothetical protein
MPRARNAAAATPPAGQAPTMTTSSTSNGCWGCDGLTVKIGLGTLGYVERKCLGNRSPRAEDPSS